MKSSQDVLVRLLADMLSDVFKQAPTSPANEEGKTTTLRSSWPTM